MIISITLLTTMNNLTDFFDWIGKNHWNHSERYSSFVEKNESAKLVYMCVCMYTSYRGIMG